MILIIVDETGFAPVWALPLIMDTLGYKNLGLPAEFLPGGGITLPQEDLATAFWSEYQIAQDEDAGCDREFERGQLEELCDAVPPAEDGRRQDAGGRFARKRGRGTTRALPPRRWRR